MDETSRTHRRGTCKERPLVEKIRLLVGFACSWVALGMPLAGFAQEPPIPTPLSLPSPSVSAIPPISVAAVLLRWEQLKPQLQSLRARAGKGDLTREIESQLGGLETSLAEQAGKDWAVLVPESSIATLSAVGSRWRSSRATLDGWTESLSGRVASLTDSELRYSYSALPGSRLRRVTRPWMCPMRKR